jgi:DNA mismatch repair protein MSH6
MFDSQVYENLEVFNIRDENDTTQKGTLFHYLNECITSSGQKLLRKWLNEPLRNEKEIK